MNTAFRLSLPLLALLLPLGAAAQPADRAGGQEFSARYSFGGSADLDAAGPGAEVGVESFQLSWRSSAALGENTRALFGIEWTRHELDRTGVTWLPENLKALAVPLGVSHRFDERWRLLVAMTPRLAGADGDFGDARVDLPLLALASYASRPELVWSFGFRYGAQSDIKLLPIAGVTWRFAPDWEFLLAWPESGLSWRATEELTLRAVATIQGGDYRLAEDPRPAGQRTGGSWAGDWFEYREVRVGLAAEYAFAPTFGLRVEGGYAVDRSFEFTDRDLDLSGDGALYAGVGLTARF